MAEEEKKAGGIKSTILAVIAFLGAKGGVMGLMSSGADDVVRIGASVADDVGRAGVAAGQASGFADEAATLSDDAVKVVGGVADDPSSGSWLNDVSTEAYEKASVVANKGQSSADWDRAAEASVRAAQGAARSESCKREKDKED